MKLVGMLDSPFVRRVAITMRMLGMDYEHDSRSVVSGYETFKDVNPLAKVPTMILDDGEMMIDSSLIINHIEAMAGRSLMPESLDDQRRAWQVIAVALLGMEKIAHRIYETKMRPEELLFLSRRLGYDDNQSKLHEDLFHYTSVVSEINSEMLNTEEYSHYH